MYIATRLKIIPFAFLLWLFPILMSSFAAAQLTAEEKAVECFESYVRALQQGSDQQAREYWNREELERYQVYDWEWATLAFRDIDLRQLNYKITSVKDQGGFVVLEVVWYYREGKAGPLQTDNRYFIQQDGKTVGANPIWVYTQGWLRKDSKHFTYHYPTSEKEPERALLDEMDRFYERVADLLYTEYAGRIDYYRCDSIEEVGKLFSAEASLARSLPADRVIASITRSAPHEVVHVVAYTILPPGERRVPPEYLSEGLAYYLGGASFFSPNLLSSWAREKMERKGPISLDSLILAPFSDGVNQGAALVCSFAKFVIETRGIRRFKMLYSGGPGRDQQREALQVVFRKSEDDIMQEWGQFVLGTAIPQITIEEPINCRTMCDFRDEKGDDKGDGDYVYPLNPKASPGIFDLTEARVSQDQESVYFQLYFSDLSHAQISSEEGFNGTFAAVVIDTDGVEHSGNTRLFFDDGNFELPDSDAYEFAVEVSNAGVLVYDQNWVWQALFLKARSLDNHVRENEIFFAVPQQIIGIPNEHWRIQVLAGGQYGGWRTPGYGVGRLMKVGQLASTDRGGGGTDTEYNPDVYDILTPEGIDQTKILGSYDLAGEKKAVVPLIRLGGK
jgi:hypothetical protein